MVTRCRFPESIYIYGKLMSENMTGHSIDIQVNLAFARANEVRALTGDNSKLNSIIGNRQCSRTRFLRDVLDYHEGPPFFAKPTY
jgi:hypothetical protein